ncbi:hypothetical protein [Saccharomonospora iraqiensis]|uniref:hypothetical protein n=1 Tax=Saccharomonospora iraqiensis TaxID=52698 RepID=UPI0012FC5FDB|nr:hypothetical protein [Saccharomonospora iraqiensis]
MTLQVEPWHVQSSESEYIGLVRERVEGAEVQAVEYYVPDGESWPFGHSSRRIHEVDMAIRIVLTCGSDVSLWWSMRGVDEGLAIGVGGPESGVIPLSGSSVLVSDNYDWESVLGSPIKDVAPVFHVPNPGCSPMPWAYQFTFGKSKKVSVALGVIQNGEIAYLPDSLVVIFDERIDHAYVRDLT